MYTVTECTTLPSNFDWLAQQNLAILEAGTIDWRYMGNPSTDAEKTSALRSAYTDYLQTDDMSVIEWKKDDFTIQLSAAVVMPFDSQYMLFAYALYGGDSNNSKAWLHDVAYIEQTRAYVRDTKNLLGFKIACHKGSSIYDYHMNKSANSSIYEVTEESITVPPDADDVEVATIRYRYLG